MDGPVSKNLIRETVAGYYLTTALWDSGYGPTYETGIRNPKNGAFWLVRHRGTDFRAGHRYVKQSLLNGKAPQDIEARE